MKDHVQKRSQDAGMSSRVRKQDLERYIMQTNLLTSVTFCVPWQAFWVWDLFSHLRSYNISLYLRYLLLCLCLVALVGLRITRVRILTRASLLANLKSCVVSPGQFFFLFLLNMEPLLKELCVVFHYVNCIYFFACLRFYFSNSLLTVSYNDDIRLSLILTVNQAGLCWIPVD